MTHELRNTREAIDDLPESNWPGPGEFMADKPLAEATAIQMAAIKQLLAWCGNFRAAPRFRNALDQLEIAQDLLRTERHR
jgi:hypothetical protein